MEEELRRRLEEERKTQEMDAALSEFREACRVNDVSFVKRIIGGLGSNAEYLQDFPVDYPTGEGVTLALSAARCGRAQLCAALLDGRADPLARDRNPEYFRDGIWPNEAHPLSGRSRLPKMEGARPGMTVVYHLRLTKAFEETMELVFPSTRIGVVQAIHIGLTEYHKKPPSVVAASMGNVNLLALLLTHSSVVPRVVPDSRVQYCSVNHGAGTPVLNERAMALMIASTHRNWRCVEVALAAGVSDISLDNTLDPPGRTALHLAAGAGAWKTVRLLLKAGASPTIYSGYGRQPLHDACVAGHLAVAQALVESGADPSMKARKGKQGIPWKASDVGLTAIEVAEQRGFREMCEYLQDCHRNRGIQARTNI